MLISFNWLKRHVDLPDSITAEEVADKLKLSTVEVENIVSQGRHLEQVVVGEILEIKNHPNADKLHLAQVDVGEKNPRQIVFGQMVKMEVGFKVPVALAPTILPGNKVIEKVEMRGELTEGMLCLDQEIGLLQDGVSIQFFDKKVKNGTPIVEVLKLNDSILEVDNKSLSNRPDLWGHYGLAWEVAALFNKKVKELPIKELKAGKGVDLKIKIEDKENCTRYIGVAVGGIKIAPSPLWLQNHLKACGVKVINNIVDISNYVNLELGRPSHAFDRRDIKDNTIIVRRAKAGEKLVTLDDVERTLTENMCLVCDAERAVDLGGIMGGKNSEIKSDTTEIILELANFNAANIRKTMAAFDLRTDAGVRFEKTLSPHLAELGLKRILTLIKEIIPTAHLISKVVDVSYEKAENRKIILTEDFVEKKIGIKLNKKQIIKILESLGFLVAEKKDVLEIITPLWRSTKDISIPEDLVEEISRIYGYENIPAQLPTFSITPPFVNELRKLEREIKNILAWESHYTESYNYSFVSPNLLKQIGISSDNLIELDNPVSKDRPYLRHNLWPNLLENILHNQRQADTLKLFEIGKVFRKEQAGMRVAENSDELLPRQDTLLCLVCAGKNIEVPFYEVGETFKNLIKHFNVEVQFIPLEKIEDAFVHAGRQALVYVNGKGVGAVAEIHPSTQKRLGLESRVGMLEINLDELLPVLNQEKKYHPLPIYPEVVRDIAFVVDKKVTHAEIVSALRKVDLLIVSVELFDVYEGKNLGENKKSLAYHLTYQSPERTLTAEEVDKVQERVHKLLEKEFKAEVRK